MRVVKTIDFWTGSFFAVLGGLAFLEALSFDEESSSYPAALGLAMLALSLALLVKTFRSTDAKLMSAEETRLLLLGPGLEVTVWVLWAFALWCGLGYIGPGFLAVAYLILRHVTDRKIRLHIAQAAAVSIGVFAIFFLIFNVPLPELEFITELLS